MISVIVATYNQEETIGRTLDSILRQRCHEPIEILIGEDCSKDSTRKICQEYAAKHPDTIRLFANEKNKGILDNYFDCVLAARGEYLADCAGDDEWCDDEKLEKELRVLEEHKDVVLVHTDYKLRYADTGEVADPVPLDYEGGINSSEEMLWHVLEHKERPAIHLGTSLWRRETLIEAYIEHTPFFRSKKYMLEDLQICAFMASKGKIAYLPDVTMLYEVGKQSISNTANSEKMFNFTYSVVSLLHDMAKTFGVEKDERMQAVYQYRLFPIVMHAFRSNKPELRNKAFRLSKELDMQLNKKLKVVKAITSNQLTWNLALLLRKVFVIAKRIK